MFAVIKTGGKQYLVEKGDQIKVEKIDQKEGSVVDFEEVLLLFEEGGTIELGKPFLKGKKVKGKIIEQARHKKVLILKHKPKKRYKLKRGHKQPYTLVEISQL